MPKLTKPSYLCHKPTGQARVRIKGHDIYLGPPYRSLESREKVRRTHHRVVYSARRHVAAQFDDRPSGAALSGVFLSKQNIEVSVSTLRLPGVRVK